jgi:hypothetical protein
LLTDECGHSYSKACKNSHQDGIAISIQHSGVMVKAACFQMVIKKEAKALGAFVSILESSEYGSS